MLFSPSGPVWDVKFITIVIISDLNVRKRNVFEEPDRLTKPKFYLCYETSIACLDLLYIIRGFLQPDEGYRRSAHHHCYKNVSLTLSILCIE